MKVAFVGGGNMAGALIGGLLRKGYTADQIAVVETDPAARQRLVQKFGVSVHENVSRELSAIETVVLAVKPQQLAVAARELARYLDGRLTISIAAGVRTADLSRWLGHQRIVRAMPNMPALVLAGVSALYAMPTTSNGDRARAESLLSVVGAVVWVEREELMDAVTAVSGSGPAYVFYFMEAVSQAAMELGLNERQVHQLTIATFLGASRLALDSTESLTALRERVTSKGGTTERALGVLESNEVKRHIVDAVLQAARRSCELGDQLGSAS